MLVLGAWIGLRTWQLWPEPPVPTFVRDVARRVVAGAQPLPPPSPGPAGAKVAISRRLASVSRMAAPSVKHVTSLDASTRPKPLPLPSAKPVVVPPVEETPGYVMGLLGMVRYGTPGPPPRTPRRWSASGWTIVRGSGATPGVATPQLGGAQAGLRVARTLDARGRVAIAGRVAAALGTRQQEAALGIEWRPTALPVRIVAERRIGVANQRGGSALGLVGGISEQPLPAGFRLDGYVQGGAVARDGVEGYADGALHIAHPVTARAGGVTMSLGVGIWGAAQRGAARLDAGPSAAIDVPIGDTPRLRIALEWRQRLAGRARPASGPALSLGIDY